MDTTKVPIGLGNMVIICLLLKKFSIYFSPVQVTSDMASNGDTGRSSQTSKAW